MKFEALYTSETPQRHLRGTSEVKNQWGNDAKIISALIVMLGLTCFAGQLSIDGYNLVKLPGKTGQEQSFQLGVIIKNDTEDSVAIVEAGSSTVEKIPRRKQVPPIGLNNMPYKVVVYSKGEKVEHLELLTTKNGLSKRAVSSYKSLQSGQSYNGLISLTAKQVGLNSLDEIRVESKAIRFEN